MHQALEFSVSDVPIQIFLSAKKRKRKDNTHGKNCNKTLRRRWNVPRPQRWNVTPTELTTYSSLGYTMYTVGVHSLSVCGPRSTPAACCCQQVCTVNLDLRPGCPFPLRRGERAQRRGRDSGPYRISSLAKRQLPIVRGPGSPQSHLPCKHHPAATVIL